MTLAEVAQARVAARARVTLLPLLFHNALYQTCIAVVFEILHHAPKRLHEQKRYVLPRNDFRAADRTKTQSVKSRDSGEPSRVC